MSKQTHYLVSIPKLKLWVDQDRKLSRKRHQAAEFLDQGCALSEAIEAADKQAEPARVSQMVAGSVVRTITVRPHRLYMRGAL